MPYKTKKIPAVLILLLVAAVFSVTLPTAPGHCETLRFVFMADSRGDSLDAPINTSALNAIISQVKALSPQPAFVVFGGDMSYRGFIDTKYTYQTWKDLFAPLTSAGIPLYTAIGNHELYRHVHGQPENGFFLENQKEYQKEFKDNPDNGPPGYERLVYSFTSSGGDAFFAVLDPYYLIADDTDPSLCGTIDDTQLAWLRAQLAQTTAIHKFLFIHTPYYYVTSSNPADPSESSCTPDATFTKLWAILDNNRFDFYACGHEHLYSRKTIDSSIPPLTKPPNAWYNNVVQLLNGTCGAGGGDTSTLTADRTLWHVFNAAGTYYFSVVDIEGAKVSVTSYGGKSAPYQVIDTFTVNRDLNPVIDLILMHEDKN